MGEFIVGDEITMRLHWESGEINLEGIVARVVQGVEQNSSDIGVQITKAERLDRARYLHFVQTLLKKAARAA
jgi:arabinogalactan endo-1,4-beta-galactosidase